MSLILHAEELRQIESVVRAQYRLQDWRSFLPIKRDINPLAEDYKVVTVEGVAPAPALISDAGGRPAPNRLPMPSLSRRQTVKTFYRMGLRYYYSDEEQQRMQFLASQNGGQLINLQNERAAANNQSFEEFLELVAANGGSTTNVAGLLGDIGLTNIATGTAISTPTDAQLGYAVHAATLVAEKPKAAGSGNTGWFDLSSFLATATAREMAIDMAWLCDAVYYGSAQRNKANELLLATPLWSIASLTFSGVESDRSALEIFRQMRPDVNVRPWFQLNGAGGSGKHRMAAFDSSDPDAPTLVLPQEMQIGAAYNSDDNLGFYQNQTLITGGVLVKKPQLVAYMDPTNQA